MILCGTCIDALVNTDYDSICRRLSTRFHLRVTYQIMGPIIKGTPKHGQYHMYTSIYNLLNAVPKSSNRKTVNILGRLNAPDIHSEFSRLLTQADITDVFYIADFCTLEECDKMTNSILNIVVNEKALTSAKNLEKRFGIPYLFFSPTYDIEKIHSYYQQLSDFLGVTIDDTAYYKPLREQVQKLKEKAPFFTCAIGERNIYSTLEAASDVMSLGFQIKSIFLRKADISDIPLLNKIARKNPEASIYFDTHPALWNIVGKSMNVDISFGVPLLYLKNSSRILDAPIHFPYIDYSSLKFLLDKLEYMLSNSALPCSEQDSNSFLKRQWRIYERSV